MRRLLVILCAAVAALLSAAVPAYGAAQHAAGGAGAGARTVRVDGYRLAVDCTGSGPRTVILLSGFGDAYPIWAGIQRDLSRTARVCSYDRPGEGHSSAPRGPQTLASEARLLHSLLGVLGIHGRVVLAGHSLGGDIAAYYAQRYSRQTAAAVLFDATPIGFLQYTLQVIPSSATGLALALRQEAVSTTTGANSEHFTLTGTDWVIPGSLGGIPLAVAEHGKDIFAGTGRYDARLQQRWARGQRHWAVLSRRSTVVVASHSGHYIYLDQPQLALSLIRGVIRDSVIRDSGCR